MIRSRRLSAPKGVKITKNKSLYLSCDDLSIQCYTLLIRYGGIRFENIYHQAGGLVLIKTSSRYTLWAEVRYDWVKGEAKFQSYVGGQMQIPIHLRHVRSLRHTNSVQMIVKCCTPLSLSWVFISNAVLICQCRHAMLLFLSNI